MSAFSDTLSQYISNKNVKVYSIAKYCDTDRSSMYKFISGKRNPPSDEIIKKMGQFMHLTPLEWQKLKESWDIARIGTGRSYERRNAGRNSGVRDDADTGHRCGRASGDGNEAGNG